MRYKGLAYRGHDPKWAFDPASGRGAAVHGGRFNPKGVPALYLATTPEGAFREATRGFAYRFDPLTLCTYEIDCEDIVDLTSNASCTAAGIDPKIMAGDWFSASTNNQRANSWQVYDRLRSIAAGILVPSFTAGATPDMINLVLWDWAETGQHSVRVHDPNHRLPKNDSSWK